MGRPGPDVAGRAGPGVWARPLAGGRVRGRVGGRVGCGGVGGEGVAGDVGRREVPVLPRVDGDLGAAVIAERSPALSACPSTDSTDDRPDILTPAPRRAAASARR